MRRPSFASLSGKRVVITGAASGIGRATAAACAREGALLYVTDQNAAGLKELAADLGDRVRVAQAGDITGDGDVARFAAAVHADGGPVDVVMNVAGVALWGTVDKLSVAQWQRTLDVNLMGPIRVIDAFVGPMITARRGGHLVNVSSAAGLVGLPWHAPYSASKFGLRGVSEVLRFDLRPYGIGVSVVCPGGVRTPITTAMRVAGYDTASPEFAKARHRFERRAVTAEQAAEAILRGVRRNRYLVYTSRDIQLLYLLERVAPPVYAAVMNVMNNVMRKVMKSVPRLPAKDGS
jgi:NAD(P)-dependent dehydrogenase (short-subunit alcohol dehydrogenase family)